MINGIFIINKHLGVTSRAIDNQIMKKFTSRKVGHLGTLDPLATGLLIVAINEGTKVLSFLEDEQKTYEATFQLGLKTSTLDLEGDVLENHEVNEYQKSTLENVLQQFVGTITQIPPLTSAIKVGGVPLYKYAHKGEQVVVPEREVIVHKLELLNYDHPLFTIRALVSKGTYIRTLGNDIAAVLNTCATTVKLVRTTNGIFSIKDAVAIEDLTAGDIISINTALPHIGKYVVSDQDIIKVKNGVRLTLDSHEKLLRIVDGNQKLLAIYEQENGVYKSRRGFNL